MVSRTVSSLAQLSPRRPWGTTTRDSQAQPQRGRAGAGEGDLDHGHSTGPALDQAAAWPAGGTACPHCKRTTHKLSRHPASGFSYCRPAPHLGHPGASGWLLPLCSGPLWTRPVSSACFAHRAPCCRGSAGGGKSVGKAPPSFFRLSNGPLHRQTPRVGNSTANTARGCVCIPITQIDVSDDPV